jgi:hypothetical protein
MSTFQLYERLKRSMTPESAEALANAFDEFSNEIRKTVTQDDFKELKDIVADLGAAQKRTEQRLDSLAAKVEELAEAQKRTEQKVEELAEAQKRTEQKVEELAEAQKRTEQRLDSLAAKVEELAEAQKRTEQKVEELAEAQKRTEITMHEGFASFDRRLGVIGSRWGDGAEEAFRQGLLEHVRHLGYTVEHFQGQDPEGYINGSARSYDLDVLVQNGTTVASEIKANASGADVTEFARSVTLFERQTGRQVDRKILVAVTIQRMATERAESLGVTVSTGFYDLEPPRT